MRRETAAISPIADVVAAIKAGEIVILVDDEDRENEGDLVFAARFVTAEKVNFLAKHGRGLICMPITESHAERLGLRPATAPISRSRSKPPRASPPASRRTTARSRSRSRVRKMPAQTTSCSPATSFR